MSNTAPIEVVGVESRPQDVRVVAQWILAEWGDGSLDETVKHLLGSSDWPSALVAVVGDQLVGVVGFRRFQRDQDAVPTLWLNVLYVLESFRGQGVGSQLLAQAIRKARRLSEPIFVYTELPEFYQTRGWRLVDQPNDAMPKTLCRKL